MDGPARPYRRHPVTLDAQSIRGTNGHRTVYGVRGLGDTLNPAPEAPAPVTVPQGPTLVDVIAFGGVAAALIWWIGQIRE